MLRDSSKKIQFYIFIAMMWVFYSLNSRYFQIPHADLVRWIVMACLILSVVIRKGFSRPPLLVGTFIVAVVASFFASIDVRQSMIKMVCFIVVVYGGYMYFASLESEEEFEIAMKIIMGIILVFELQNIVAIIGGFGYEDGTDRAIGITTNANTLGGYSNLAMLASYYWAVKSDGRKKLIYILLMLCSIWTCLLSGSRGGFVVMALMLLSILILRLRNNFFKILIIISAIMLVKITFSGGLSFLNIEAINRLTSEGGTDRGELWQLGLNVWKKYPIFGCGYTVSNRYNTLEGLVGFPFHNSYITILAEIGIWGVAILGTNLFENLFKAVSVLKYETRYEPVNIFLINCLMMFTQLVAAYSESFLFAVGSTEACTFWMLLTWNIAYRNFKVRRYM